MQNTNKAATDEGKAPREQYVKDGAIRCAISQGYSQETADAFARWALAYVPEVQGFANLFDYYMSKQD